MRQLVTPITRLLLPASMPSQRRNRQRAGRRRVGHSDIKQALDISEAPRLGEIRRWRGGRSEPFKKRTQPRSISASTRVSTSILQGLEPSLLRPSGRLARWSNDCPKRVLPKRASARGGLRRTVEMAADEALAGEWFTVVMGRRIVGLARTGSLPSGRDAALTPFRAAYNCDLEGFPINRRSVTLEFKLYFLDAVSS